VERFLWVWRPILLSKLGTWFVLDYLRVKSLAQSRGKLKKLFTSYILKLMVIFVENLIFFM